MRWAVLLVLLVGCDRSSRVTVGPGCRHTYFLTVGGVRDGRYMVYHYPDCTRQNVDSLRARGVLVTWDTTRSDP